MHSSHAVIGGGADADAGTNDDEEEEGEEEGLVCRQLWGDTKAASALRKAKINQISTSSQSQYVEMCMLRLLGFRVNDGLQQTKQRRLPGGEFIVMAQSTEMSQVGRSGLAVSGSKVT